MRIAKYWHYPLRNRPVIYLPVPCEWKLEGDVTTVTRYEYHRVPILGMPSVENLDDAEIQMMDEYDTEEGKQMAGGEE